MTTYDPLDVQDPAVAALHSDLARQKFIPGWYRPGNPPLWDSPRTSFKTAMWSYRAARDALSRAGTSIGMEFSERRNLIMTNPAEGNRYPTVRTLVLAYQMLLPGERARTHRHSPHAGRLVIDADEGAYTVVEGVRLALARSRARGQPAGVLARLPRRPAGSASRSDVLRGLPG
jgi:gentisate 1,2-dioxygenase